MSPSITSQSPELPNGNSPSKSTSPIATKDGVDHLSGTINTTKSRTVNRTSSKGEGVLRRQATVQSSPAIEEAPGDPLSSTKQTGIHSPTPSDNNTEPSEIPPPASATPAKTKRNKVGDPGARLVDPCKNCVKKKRVCRVVVKKNSKKGRKRRSCWSCAKDNRSCYVASDENGVPHDTYELTDDEGGDVQDEELAENDGSPALDVADDKMGDEDDQDDFSAIKASWSLSGKETDSTPPSKGKSKSRSSMHLRAPRKSSEVSTVNSTLKAGTKVNTRSKSTSGRRTRSTAKDNRALSGENGKAQGIDGRSSSRPPTRRKSQLPSRNRIGSEVGTISPTGGAAFERFSVPPTVKYIGTPIASHLRPVSYSPPLHSPQRTQVVESGLVKRTRTKTRRRRGAHIRSV